MAVAATAEIIAFDTLPEDGDARERAANLIALAGEAALSQVAEIDFSPGKKQPDNLLEAAKMAASGSELGEKMVRANAHTDVFERTIKAGFVQAVPLEVNEQGEIGQNGQTNQVIQMNTAMYLGHSKNMQPRYQAETNNAFRLQMAKDNGLLDEYNFLVLSRYPDEDEMSDKVAEQNGFFTHTKSLMVQSTGYGTNSLQTETAFVAGVASRNAERHDAEMVGKFGDTFGVDLRKSASATIDTPLLVHKSLMPNGVVDIVRLLDEGIGNTFFGQAVEATDYVKFRQECLVREKEMRPTVDAIVRAFIAEADRFQSPLQATERLSKLSAEHTLLYALEDHRIDARVYGEEAAWYLQDARAHFEIGDMLRVKNTLQKALRTEKSSSCPTGTKVSVKLDELEKPQFTLYENEDEEGDETLEDCDFISKECPKCGAKDVKTECRNGVYIGECGCRSK